MLLIQRLFSIAVVLAIVGKIQATSIISECGGEFRVDHECSMASDGNWSTSIVPDAYNDSAYVIENQEIPPGVVAGYWRFKVLRNNPAIEVRVHYWDYDVNEWTLLHEAPVNLDYATYTIQVPPGGLAHSPMRIKTSVKNASAMSGEYFEGVADWVFPDIGYECQGVFRSGHECLKSVDADTLTSAVPDAYGDSIAVIEYHEVPQGAISANWHFRVLRNTNDIEIRAFYWNCESGKWELLYNAPVNPDYANYVVSIPANALLNSQLKTKMHVKNASIPLMSGEYCEGQMDWIFSQPSTQIACEGIFREGHECSMAADGNWVTSAVPNAYGDSVNVIEEHTIPLGAASATWTFKVLRNTGDIKIAAYYWNYTIGEWSLLYSVPLDLNYSTYTVPFPQDALLGSSLKTRMSVKNASTPAMSGEFCEGVIDWTFQEPHFAYEGCFRSGHEDHMAIDGDWMTSAVPDNYGDSIFIVEKHSIPSNAYAAFWNFKVLRNDPAIEIRAHFFDYESSTWELLLDVPVSSDYSTYSVPVPVNALLHSPLVTRMSIKNAPAMSGEYFEGAFDFREFLCGDANNSHSTNISDAVYIINYIFSGGPAPNPMIAGDANCDGQVDISDAVYLINYIFSDGPAPCANCGAFAPKLATGSADISVTPAANRTATEVAVNLSTSSDARAIQLNFNFSGDVRNIQVKPNVADLQLFTGEVDGGYRVGLIDLTGTAAIPSGKTQIATITYEGDGELSIASAIVVDNDASEMNVTIANSKVENVLPMEYSLSQNQPNPFNPSTDISFSLPKTGQVKLVVYNILGAEVATLIDEVRSAGVHHVRWNGTNSSGQQVASGIYLYRLTAGDFAATKKMLLLK